MTVENENCDMTVDRMISLFKIIAIMITGSCKDSSYQFYVKLKKNFLIYRLQILVIYLKSSSYIYKKWKLFLIFLLSIDHNYEEPSLGKLTQV